MGSRASTGPGGGTEIPKWTGLAGSEGADRIPPDGSLLAPQTMSFLAGTYIKSGELIYFAMRSRPSSPPARQISSVFVFEIKTITSKYDSRDWINGICEKCFAESDGLPP